VYSTVLIQKKTLILEEVLTPQPNGSSGLLTMMKDQYANYVVQKNVGCL